MKQLEQCNNNLSFISKTRKIGTNRCSSLEYLGTVFVVASFREIYWTNPLLYKTTTTTSK